MSRSKKYDYKVSNALISYVKRKVKKSAFQVYSFGLPFFERKQNGLSKPVTASHKDISRYLRMSRPTVSKALMDLRKTGFIEYVVGESSEKSKTASMIRRRTFEEIKTGEHKFQLSDWTTPDARKLADIFNSRTFVYGNDFECKPYCSPTKTGRITSRQPNVQGDSAKLRFSKLMQGLKPGEKLFCVDCIQAEPTILRHILRDRGFKFPPAPYEELAKILDIDRNEAKKRFNSLSYSKSAIAIVNHWPELPDGHYIWRYAEALDSLKSDLMKAPRKHVTTLGGNIIGKQEGEVDFHRGKLLNWLIAGTLSDIVNSAILEIIERERDEGWMFLFQVHDGIYIKSKNKNAGDKIIEIIKRHSKALGIRMECTVKWARKFKNKRFVSRSYSK